MSELRIYVDVITEVTSNERLPESFSVGLQTELDKFVKSYLSRFRRSYEKAQAQKKKMVK